MHLDDFHPPRYQYHLCIDFVLIMPKKKYDKSRKNFAKFANIEKLLFIES